MEKGAKIPIRGECHKGLANNNGGNLPEATKIKKPRKVVF